MELCMYFCKMNKVLLEIIGLSYTHSQSEAYALILGEKNSKLRIPIIIGSNEAQSIAIALENINPPRPLTHDLFKNFAVHFGISLKEVIINKFKEGIFFAELHCSQNEDITIIDARASDAIALAIRFQCPIYTCQQVMDEAGIEYDDNNGDDNSNDNDDNDDNDLRRYDTVDLKYLLQEAIDDEDYEKASKLRDEINSRIQ